MHLKILKWMANTKTYTSEISGHYKKKNLFRHLGQKNAWLIKEGRLSADFLMLYFARKKKWNSIFGYLRKCDIQV